MKKKTSISGQFIGSSFTFSYIEILSHKNSGFEGFFNFNNNSKNFSFEINLSLNNMNKINLHMMNLGIPITNHEKMSCEILFISKMEMISTVASLII